jgi:hypothetical protein
MHVGSPTTPSLATKEENRKFSPDIFLRLKTKFRSLIFPVSTFYIRQSGTD